MEAEIYQFTIGQTFKTYDGLKEHFLKFCEQNYQPFVIRSHSKQQIIYKCCHGIQRKTKCKGQRPNQHYYFKGCSAQINLYKSKENKWKVTKIELSHNHTISKEKYSFHHKIDKLQRNGFELVTDLVLANANDTVIAEDVEKKSGRHFIRKDKQNIRNKLFPSYTEANEEQLNKFLIRLEEEGGKCAITYSDENTIKTLFVASRTMIANFKKSQPSLIQIDLSFDFNVENYKLMGYCYYSSITAKSEFAAMALISEETVINLKECLLEFRNMCVYIPSVFLIDKDFTEISVIRDVFSSSVILLYKFHVIKYFKKLIFTAQNCDVHMKNNMLQLFKKVLYSRTSEEYYERKTELLNLAIAVEVNVQNKCISLIKHFVNNWDSCKEMWVYCYRKHLPIMDDSTTNNVERSFCTLKNHTQNKFCTVPSVSVSIIELIKYVTLRIQNSVSDTIMEKANSSEKEIKNSDDSDNEEKQLTNSEKFNMAFTAVKNIAEVLSNHGTPRFLNYIQELKIIENNAREGLPLLNNSTSSNEIYNYLNHVHFLSE